ncbi:type II toxin-antitoxin system RatA family toxin [Methylococcus mesophilus]|uniref:type II toxin-antitoxin system RatA family toxin n=1 Tax=Methylococcus mesophilus TaxID=2993564 RepID=UPI00224ADAC5|nr:type II toxin-antitoxin system RatA family toxin [Methylococcus mesophilus]UZR29525.1 type II toxin-antitoxin system RatA family toxin [Methylococcus mesophilus]
MMPTISTSVCVNYTQDQMYELVNDVADYPKYLPLCRDVRVLSAAERHVKATITLAKGAVRLNFTTANTMEPGRHIHMKLVDGPFKYLRGNWRFDPNPHGGCDVSFRVDFEFANPLLQMALGGIFREVMESLVAAFCNQAAKRYGNAGPALPQGPVLDGVGQTGPA